MTQIFSNMHRAGIVHSSCWIVFIKVIVLLPSGDPHPVYFYLKLYLYLCLMYLHISIMAVGVFVFNVFEYFYIGG